MKEGSSDRRAVVCISSHVARGTVGNRAAAFALEALGFPVWVVPTVTLPWHPGHGLATRIVPGADAFDALMSDLRTSPFRSEVGAILTGYFGDPEQVAPVARFIRTLKEENPDTLYICDPVLGDDGRRYQPEATIRYVAEELIPLADIVTPNRFELEILARRPLADNAALAAAALELGVSRTLVTSAYAMLRDGTGNLLVEGEEACLCEHRVIPGAPHGLGDLTAAMFLARTLSGAEPEKALSHATAAVFEILARTTKRGADELTLETDTDSLRHPMAMVHFRRVSLGRSRA